MLSGKITLFSFRMCRRSISIELKNLPPFKNYLNNFVDGEFVDTGCKLTNNVVSPRTGEKIGETKISNVEDVTKCVMVAKEAFNTFSQTDILTRSRILKNISELIRKQHFNDLAVIETLNTGKILKETTEDVISAADCFEYFSAQILTTEDKYIPLSPTSYILKTKEPLGVCAGIGAWNFPIANAAWKVAPALAMGNTFIFKPSELTPLTACFLADICVKAGLPKGVFNVLQGDATTGKLLCENENIAKISFTGSVESGKRVAEICAKQVKRVTLELGGKSPLIVFEDACISDAVNGALLANFTSQGQICSNAARVYIHKSIYEQFKVELIRATKMINVGDPFNENIQSGCIMSLPQLLKILNYVKSAKDQVISSFLSLLICFFQGVKILYGGERIHFFDNKEIVDGYYFQPCIMEGFSNSDMNVLTEEIFGPVMCLIPFDNEEEVMQLSNKTQFGLSAGVYTKDLSRAHRIARRFDAGTIYVNTYNMYPLQMPFGGRKNSGYGRENGSEVLAYYSDTKSILVETESTPNPFQC